MVSILRNSRFSCSTEGAQSTLEILESVYGPSLTRSIGFAAFGPVESEVGAIETSTSIELSHPYWYKSVPGVLHGGHTYTVNQVFLARPRRINCCPVQVD